MPTDYIADIRRLLTEINSRLKAKAEPGSSLATAQIVTRTRLQHIHTELSAIVSNLNTWQAGPSETKED